MRYRLEVWDEYKIKTVIEEPSIKRLEIHLGELEAEENGQTLHEYIIEKLKDRSSNTTYREPNTTL